MGKQKALGLAEDTQVWCDLQGRQVWLPRQRRGDIIRDRVRVIVVRKLDAYGNAKRYTTLLMDSAALLGLGNRLDLAAIQAGARVKRGKT